MEINFSFPALILASGYLGFACAACLGKAGLSYLFHALSQIFRVWNKQTGQEMSAQKREGAGGTVAAVTPEWCGVGRHLTCPWDSVSPCDERLLVVHVFLYAGWLMCSSFCSEVQAAQKWLRLIDTLMKKCGILLQSLCVSPVGHLLSLFHSQIACLPF